MVFLKNNMKIKLLSFFITLFLFYACNEKQSENIPTELNYIYSFSVSQIILDENVNRKFWVRIPKKTTKNKYPIVMFFHGNGDEAFNFYQRSSEIKDLIDDGEFIGIFPNGHLRSWNCGNENSKANDVEFVNMIIDFLKSNTQPADLMDYDKIYGIGISNGGLIVNKIAKETSLFRAIAPIVSQQSDVIGKTISKRSLSVFQINGTNDDLIPVEGGNSPVGHVFLSAKNSAENWAVNSKCDLNNLVEKSSIWGDFKVSSFSYINCENSHVVSYHLVDGAGHQSNYGLGDLIYNRIWNFLKEY